MFKIARWLPCSYCSYCVRVFLCAVQVLGCFGLRQGASGVLVLNALYGLCLARYQAGRLRQHGKGQGATFCVLRIFDNALIIAFVPL